ncbi:16S rRNA (cytidine(1402)-2'-O)-methyltransferase [Halobacillus karajensis]|uniref:Ribosomal RNA small subunit methyltransferase I n=1 Tax=Halobacillus karajensis TaxID=195088 RepID=A0A024P9K8_9BACI|nr:16S rRNA (cytidine(1402)-2'-O)-methyltransferase [Halobacillus karajensis]CDQ21763.1 Ribosomal RNA small subunit methyltransferase I [Halobacillus karajensis]CDQ25759.1 Ribosomal RNA small subunit methyltransferase I [Halobacillus karajensis]CDQ29760.1 Ribosomal RNA small subunit methyltransferase I [Halobacillus karajensis]
MKVQKSFNHSVNKGIIYIVPTPIGNLEDMTFRAVKTLKEVDLIGAEDTRNTKKLLNHFEISTSLVSYHEHNKHSKGPQLIDRVLGGESIAIVSDAGMPGISDPGTDLVQRAVEVDIPVVVLPGANAALPALAGSGLPTEEFYFCGFLPRKKKDRSSVLDQLQAIQATLIFYESPHRLKEMLSHMYEVFGARKASLVRELTKRYEEYVRGDLGELVDWASTQEVRGEFCVIVEGGQGTDSEVDSWWTSLSLVDHVDHYMEEEGMRNKEAIKQASLDRGIPKREVYQAYHVDEK